MWQGEVLELEAFTSQSHTHFDGGPVDDRGLRAVSGGRLTSSSEFLPGWTSRLSIGEGRDRLTLREAVPSFIESREQQGAWVNQFSSAGRNLVLGLETVRRRISAHEDAPFARSRMDTDSGFATYTESIDVQRFEGAVRRDRGDAFGDLTSGSMSYGIDWPSVVRIAGTYSRGYQAPTMLHLYGPTVAGFTPNPALRPERNRSYEVTATSLAPGAFQWKATVFDTRVEDLIVLDAAQGMPVNAPPARLQGIEARVDAAWQAIRWTAGITLQRAREEETGLRLQGRAQAFGWLQGTYVSGPWTVGLAVTGSGAQSEPRAETSGTGGYAVVDARVRYAIDKRWSAEIAGTNLFDNRYETVHGYDAPRRAVLLSVRFESY
jgi:outer membrane cobalamin receptor